MPEEPELCECCGEAIEDCRCFVCPSCNKKTDDSACENCEACPNCCECYVCDACGERVRQRLCSNCEMCDNCCECEAGPRHEQQLRIEKPLNLKGFKRNILARPIGIELEISDISEPSFLTSFAHATGAGLVEDGSIPDKGCEINTNPACGDIFTTRMRELSNAVKDAGAKITSDCGLHVHVDASDYTQWDLRRIMIYWTGIERAMFELVARDRHHNHYCEPCSSTFADILSRHNLSSHLNWRQRLAYTMYAGVNRRVPEKKAHKYEKCRYMALSLHSYNLRKTLEFRMHEARLEDYVLICWPLVCGHIVDFAYHSTERDLLRMLKSNRTSLDMLLAALPSDLQEWVITRMRERREARRQAGTIGITEDSLNEMEQARRNLKIYPLWQPTAPTRKVKPQPSTQLPLTASVHSDVTAAILTRLQEVF